MNQFVFAIVQRSIAGLFGFGRVPRWSPRTGELWTTRQIISAYDNRKFGREVCDAYFAINWAPGADQDTYLVLEDFGRLGCAWRETDADDVDRETLIGDLWRAIIAIRSASWSSTPPKAGPVMWPWISPTSCADGTLSSASYRARSSTLWRRTAADGQCRRDRKPMRVNRLLANSKLGPDESRIWTAAPLADQKGLIPWGSYRVRRPHSAIYRGTTNSPFPNCRMRQIAGRWCLAASAITR